MQPHTSYLICSTPRSGSSLLCEALKDTNVGGRPAEYFSEHNEAYWSERWNVSNYPDYIKSSLEEGTTPNGVFGGKVMWTSNFPEFTQKLGKELGRKHMPVHDLLSSVFPNLHYIWLGRRDKVRQAVSQWKASQTGIWADRVVPTREHPPQPAELRFRFGFVDELVQSIVSQEASWQQYFDVFRI
jgi:LPS sulfotransferase NodH